MRKIDAEAHQFGEWISVKDKLPEEHDTIFAKYKDTPKWRESMFEKTSGQVLITLVNKDNRVVIPACTCDGVWKADLLRACKDAKIVSWMPFPEPSEEDEDDGR